MMTLLGVCFSAIGLLAYLMMDFRSDSDGRVGTVLLVVCCAMVPIAAFETALGLSTQSTIEREIDRLERRQEVVAARLEQS